MQPFRQLNTSKLDINSSFAGKQRGVGMVEVLITLFILSVGLLGVASLQFVGSLSNSDALNRTQAVMVAQQFTERLLASATPTTQSDGFVIDNAYFNNSAYNFSGLSCTSGRSSYACFCETHLASVPNCQTGECTAAEFAEYDAYQMSCAVTKNNPNATINLSCNDQVLGDLDACSAGSMHTVTIKWPVKSLQNNQQQLNSQCNTSPNDSFDCVVVELTL